MFYENMLSTPQFIDEVNIAYVDSNGQKQISIEYEYKVDKLERYEQFSFFLR